MSINWSTTKVAITGATGMIGWHLIKALSKRGCDPFVMDRYHVHGVPFEAATEILFHCAGLTTGIHYTKDHPASLMTDQLRLDMDTFEAARKAGIKKIIAIGCGCGYPKDAPQPYREEDYCKGWPGDSHAHFGLAKQILWALATAYYREYGIVTHVAIPSNVYGPWDKFDEERSHVVAGLIRKNYEAMKNGSPVIVFGDGMQRRDFIHASDVAEGLIELSEIEEVTPEITNLSGPSEDGTRISFIAHELSRHSGAKVLYDHNAPQGDLKRLFSRDIQKIILPHWTPKIGIIEGLHETWDWYVNERESGRMPG